MASPSRDPFERIYRRHVGDVYRFALAVLRNPTEAEDVTQATFLNAYRAFKRGDRPKRVNSWLIAIAHNAIRSRRRWSLRRPREVPLDEALHRLDVAPEDQATVAEVLELLGQLPETQRTALALRELEGRSYAEIAETLGVTVSAVESLIARARRTLREKHAGLRGLVAVPLPRSLRNWLAQGDAAGTSLAMKAAVVIAAAGALAGGAAITSHTAGATKKPTRTTSPEPSRPYFAPVVELRGAQARAVEATATASKRAASTKHGQPPTPLPTNTEPAARGTTPPRRPGADDGTRTVTTPTGATVVFREPTPPSKPTLPTLPTLPSPPSSLDPSTWKKPTPPQLPTAPEPPSAPQVPAPGGIK